LAVPPGRVVELMASGAPAATREMVMVAAADWAGEPASLTVTPKGKFPLAVGVPETRPVEGAKLSPAGRLLPPLIDQV
jgi:hypothetical protein